MISLAERMKGYEAAASGCLPINVPIIMRIDGRAFHNFTKQFIRPFDNDFATLMNKVAKGLCNEIPNTRVAYLQSDEISILIYNTIESDVWFGNNIQKMTSVSASIATMWASYWLQGSHYSTKYANFDSRVFAVPEKDVNNYFIWRQRDWERNSLHMVCRAYYSQEELQGKNGSEMHQMLFKKDINWNNLDTSWKRGRCILKVETPLQPLKSKWKVDNDIPIFTKDRDYIEKFLKEANGGS